MFIEVRINEVLFNGDAEDFLEENCYDDELECFLNNLDRCEVGTKKSYYGYIFEKVKEPCLWEEE